MNERMESPGGDIAQPGPSWPPETWISPTALKNFNTCPYRVRLRYLEKVPEPHAFSLNLSKGRIAHDLLAMSAKRIAGDLPDQEEDWFYQQAYRRLPRSEFPSDEAHVGNARDIARWVCGGLRYLDRDAGFLRIEKGDHREVPWQPEGTHLTLMTRPDLVLLRTGPEGEPFIEFIDYKTGKQRLDDIVPVVMRYAFTGYFKTLVPDTQSTRMQFTWLWLESGEINVTDLSLDYSISAWKGVRQNIELLMAEREWPAQPSHLCNYCPYNGNACTAFDAMKGDSEPF